MDTDFPPLPPKKLLTALPIVLNTPVIVKLLFFTFLSFTASITDDALSFALTVVFLSFTFYC